MNAIQNLYLITDLIFHVQLRPAFKIKTDSLCLFRVFLPFDYDTNYKVLFFIEYMKDVMNFEIGNMDVYKQQRIQMNYCLKYYIYPYLTIKICQTLVSTVQTPFSHQNESKNNVDETIDVSGLE